MKTAGVFLAGVVVAGLATFLWLKSREETEGVGFGGPPDCVSDKAYAAVTKVFQKKSGICVVTMDIDDPSIDVPGHPEVALRVTKDVLVFTHHDSKRSKFFYTHKQDVANSAATCPDTPFYNPDSSVPQDMHNPGSLNLRIWDAANEKPCRYKLSFIRKAPDKDIDPHIAVGR